jgi:hypothetical protein
MTTHPTPLENPTVPGLGQNVLYTLTRLDAEVITGQRYRAGLAAAESPYVIGPSGNDVHAGDVYPACVVRVRGVDPDAGINLQVRLDGNDVHWVEHAVEGTTPGTWAWPAI